MLGRKGSWASAARGARLRGGLITSVALTVFALATPSAGAATWTLQSVPARVIPNGGLLSISCTSSTSCEGVGFFLDALGEQRSLAEVSNGSTWTAQTAVSKGTLSFLADVSCPGAASCVAVGGAGTGFPTHPLAESWNGTTWTAMITPLPTGAGEGHFTGVSCLSATSCVAVGSYVSGANQSLPLSEVWNGTKWVVKPAVTPAGATQTALNSISCLSASSCIAVGDYTTSASASTPNLALAESWNGTAWTLQSAATPAGATAAQLTGVSCASSAMCMAVGGYDSTGTVPRHALSEVWNGSSWTLQTTPEPSGGSTLSHVSCPTVSDCTAVGSPLTFTPVIEQWSAGTWSIQTPATRPGQFTMLSGVSCSASSACTAGGATGSGQFVAPASLAEAWNGSAWTIQTTVDKSGATGTSFTGLTCISGTSCEAVGNYLTNTTPQRAAAAAWNGTKWTLQSAKSSGSRSSLAGVSCPAATTCIAVGSRTTATNAMLPFAQIWNGTSWTIQTVPNVSGSSGAQLKSVSCPSSSSCVAVGMFVDNTTGHTLALIETWNGTAWTALKAPEPAGVTYASLNGVSCPATSPCLAVGGYATTVGAFSPTRLLALKWDGVSWTVLTPTTPAGATAATFTGASCTSPTACEVVGGYTTTAGGTFPTTTLAETWNGSVWNLQTTPSPQPGGFGAASCAAASACTAVGQTMFAENWDGLSWTTQSLAAPPTQSSQLTAVSCATTTTCTIAGTYQRNFWVAPIFGNSIWVQEVQLPFAEQSS